MAEALSGTCSVRGIEPADIAVFVKEVPPPHFLEIARRKCNHVIYDPIDNYRFHLMIGLEVDGVIACSSLHMEHLDSIILCRLACIIPHHHCIISAEKLVNDRSLVGYVGDDGNLGIRHDKLLDAFPDCLCGRDMSILRKIGIGIAYRPDTDARKYKSGIKLANYWAHGIAAICSPDNSYLEMGTDGEDMLVAESDDDVISLARKLSDDVVMRKKLIAAGMEKAKEYHIGRIKFLYLSMLEELNR